MIVQEQKEGLAVHNCSIGSQHEGGVGNATGSFRRTGQGPRDTGAKERERERYQCMKRRMSFNVASAEDSGEVE